MTTENKKSTNSTHTDKKPCGDELHEDLPAVSKQTAGGIAGAMIGGLVAGPVGAIVAGVAGALVGNASAAGHRPIEKTVDAIRDVTEEPARRAYDSIVKAVHPDKTKKTTSAKKKSAAHKKAD